MDTIPSFQGPLYEAAAVDPDQQNTDQIDDDMDRLFHEEQGKEDFSLADLSEAPGESAQTIQWTPDYSSASAKYDEVSRIKESDISFHRSDSFPHVHHPLKPSHVRRRTSSKSISTDKDKAASEKAPNVIEEVDDEAKPDVETKDSKELKAPKADKGAVSFEVGDPELEEGWSNRPPATGVSEKENLSYMDQDSDEERETSPLLVEDASLRPCIRQQEPANSATDDESRKKSRVQFDIEEDVREYSPDQKEKHRRRRHRRNRRDSYEDPSRRRHAGSDHELARKWSQKPTTEEEAVCLHEHYLEEMSSHRFDDPSAYRRHRIRARSSVSSIIHPSSQDKHEEESKLPIMKKTIDHDPHEVFVELDELMYNEGNYEWKETARWIKYEEDVEDGANRWGKPHIAFLNFHALFSLRRGLDTGAVLLDLEEKDLPSIAARVVDKMVACDQIPADQRDSVIKVLLLRHKHIRDNQSSFRLPSMGSKSQLQSSEEKLSQSPTTVSSDGNLRASVRKAGLSNLFHVNTFGSFRRRSSVDDTSGVLANGELQAKDVRIEKGLNRNEPHTKHSPTLKLLGLSMREKVAPTLSPKKETEWSVHDADVAIDIDGEATGKDKGSRDDLRKNKDNIMKKIPEGAEATAVLVGAVDFLKHPTIAFVRLAEGVPMDNIIEVPIPVRFMFILLGPFHGEMDYHEVGRSISTLMSDKGFHEVAYRAHSRGQLLSAINEFLNASIVMPPSDWNNKDLVPIDDIRAKAQQINKKNESIRAKRKQSQSGDGGDLRPPPRDPLERMGKPFYGLIQDIKIRYPKYLSDITDGLNGQVAAAAIFIFFAALSAAITFGGMYGDQTENMIGVGETLLVSCINGVIFALFAAQPLLIVGATGPLMIFDMSLYAFCIAYDIEFLPARVWIGVWMTIWGLLIVAFEALAIVKKFTRFTEEIFSTLVCLIFIYEAFVKLYGIFEVHPLKADYCYEDENHTQIVVNQDILSVSVNGTIINGTLYDGVNADGKEVDAMNPAQPNTSLLSFILMIGTFIIAYKLKHFRNSKFLGRSVRRALGDFGVPISIVLMVTVDFLVRDTYTDKLTMPDGMQPSRPEERGWLINPMGINKSLPVWVIFACAPASLLLLILIFLEENICHLILSKPERNMQKGSGFHLDLVLSCSINAISGILGAPFMGPACVRTVSHTSALTVMSAAGAPGESPKMVGVKEQRLSALVVSVLIGLSVFLTAVLNLVPKAVLFGIFLYMGVSSTAGIQFLERIFLFFMPVKHHPSVPYVKKVRTWKMHAFTAVQLVLLIVLWVVKQSPAALCFPFVLLLLLPIRLYLLPYLFNSTELVALDGKDSSATADEEEENDFYEEAHDLPTQIDHHHQS
ncbi:band 3 anion transport protein-like isoform X2 [Oratosquilla oratoria]|uniref:band 3 anion transport protein-like isoform X2 n=1 Tax=Oratosquilla oratoria TaxID=337810 RepID=UPI003F75D93E